MKSITDMEFKLLQAIDKSEYGKSMLDRVRMSSVADNITGGLSGETISGLISSLIRKDLVRKNAFTRTIRMTREGAQLYVEYCHVRLINTNKAI